MSKRKPLRMTNDRLEKRDGVLGEIWDKFFRGIFFGNHFSKDYNSDFFHDLLEKVFANRHIYTARCKKDLKALGGFVDSNSVPNFGAFDNTIRKNTRVWVRDDKYQNYVDVETEDGRVFRMSNKQYKEIRRYFTKEQ